MKSSGGMKTGLHDAAVGAALHELRDAFERRDFQRADQLLDVLREIWVDADDHDSGGADGHDIASRG